ncbi:MULTISPECIES: hypothetical protein [unclassified Sphingopyxis]|jgi:hypothetical protein|uniref:hypothetical protein n=1 Tax=unclassified Sphingopyxis TaxID=2614943 RepID=UPI0028600F4D|nr:MULTISPECIES: hypothetical protein [unclassified Sphingopyxis]MDR6832242.1 hypothetical protein [Sphingopyxis sp. BE122]MDR7227985.1 hypothetical protein [Sphingopyxis sp. BE259]
MSTESGTAAAPAAAPAPAPITPATDLKTKGGDKLAAWSGFSLILGLAGDMATPIGNYSLWLMAAGIVGFVLCFLLRRMSFARRGMFHTGIFALIMGTIWGLQQFAVPEEAGVERGATVAFLPILAPIQTKILPLPQSQKLLLQFQDSIAKGSDSERVAAARELYAATGDAALHRGMIETMMGSGNPALQQSATLLRLAERKRDRLTLLPIDRDTNDPLARRLLSFSFEVRDVDVDSGALDLRSSSSRSFGTVTRQGTTMQLPIIVAENSGWQDMLVDLKPGNDMRLTGKARLETGEVVAVELPLF